MAGLQRGGVEGLEFGQRRIDFAADLEDFRPALSLQRLGDVLQGAQIGGDVLARAAVSAGGAPDQDAVLVADRGGQAVDLRLGGEGHRLGGLQLQEAPDAGDEIDHLRIIKGIVEAEHRHAVHHGRELGRARRADLQGWAVVAHERREARLDRGVAPLQRVIVGVADRGRVVLVVADVVGRDLVRQAGEFVCGLGFGQVFDGLGI